MGGSPYTPTSVETEAEFKAIEQAARDSFGRAASVLRTSIQDETCVLVAINTQRIYGHFAILEFNRKTKNLHTGHYFDSTGEAAHDFNSRDTVKSGGRWVPLCQICWQDEWPDQYVPTLTEYRECARCGQSALTVMVNPKDLG